jgi:hypothetical protein
MVGEPQGRRGPQRVPGGFLGLDNIGVFDRSARLPTGGHIDQSDGTSWMAMYALNLMRIALELAQQNHVYEDIATKFFEHFLQIAHAISGHFLTLEQVAEELSRRLSNVFLRNEEGNRPVLGQYPQLQDVAHFRDYVPFFEYFCGDTGRGVGASHQTGWTALVAKLLMPRRHEFAPGEDHRFE